MKRTILLIPLALAVSVNIRAQSIGPATLNVTGGTTVIGSNEYDWSVGEMTMISTFTATGIIVTQGVLQPAESASGVANVSLLSKQLQVFPNPATSVVNVQYSSQVQGTLTYRLMDVAGKVIAERAMTVSPGTTTEQVNVSELACATYMLEVTVNAGNATPESISYKIQKLK